jgi:hypothetical protein
MPGTVPVDRRLFVLAKNKREALNEADTELQELRKEYPDEQEVVANVVTLENLIPARNSSGDDRMGHISLSRLSEVELSLEADREKYYLGVCLIRAD